MSRSRVIALLSLLVTGCSGHAALATDDGLSPTADTPLPQQDAGFTDPDPSDGGAPEAGPSEAGPSDAGPSDAGPSDAGPTVLDGGYTFTGYRVVPLFITASDSTRDEIAHKVATYERAVVAIRNWYSERLGAARGFFTFHRQAVTILPGHFSKQQWNTMGTTGFVYPDGGSTGNGGSCSMWYGAQFELESEGLLQDAGLPSLGSPGIVYYAVMGGGTNGSCGAAGYLAASEGKLLDDADLNCPTGRYSGGAAPGGTLDCQAIGAIAHELGHGFGLPHCSARTTCTGRSIMDFWWEFDRPTGATLSAEDKSDLTGSGWMFPP